MDQYYGISSVKDRYYGAAVALTYAIFKSRDRKGPASGTKTWSVLGSRIAAAANGADTIERYLQLLAEGLKSWINPKELARVVNPESRIFRVNSDGSEIVEFEQDKLEVFGHRDLLVDVAFHECDGFESLDEDSKKAVVEDIELQVLDLIRKEFRIIECLCNIKHNIDKELGQDESVDEYIEVEVAHVE